MVPRERRSPPRCRIYPGAGYSHDGRTAQQKGGGGLNTQYVKDTTEKVSANLSSLQCLLSAVDDKIRFYLLDGQTYGPYSEIVHYHAKELQGLLAIMEGILSDADRDLDTVIHALSDALKREAAA